MWSSRPILLGLALGSAAACGAARHPVPLSEGAHDRDATRIAEDSFTQSYGFDALEAYDLVGLGPTIRFAVARKWESPQVKLLAYVVEPEELDDLAFLVFREPGQSDDVLTYATRPVAVSAEVVRPVFPDEFTHRRLPDQEVDGELCSVIEGRPAGPSPRLTRIVAFVSQRTGVALRTVYYRGGTELRRVIVSAQDVRRYDSRWLPSRRTVRTADGREASLVLRNLLTDVALPDQVFTARGLRLRRFPKF